MPTKAWTGDTVVVIVESVFFLAFTTLQAKLRHIAAGLTEDRAGAAYTVVEDEAMITCGTHKDTIFILVFTRHTVIGAICDNIRLHYTVRHC